MTQGRPIVLHLLLTILAIACPHARAADGPVTIRFWAVTGAIEDAAMFRELAARFEQETGVRVEVTPLSWGSFETNYFTAMAAGEPPDIGISNLAAPFDYGSVGGLVDLRAAFPDEIGELESMFYPGLLHCGRVGDKLYGLPADITTTLVFYRTDIFERLGLRPPETWAEMKQTIRRIEAAGMRFYFGWPRGEQYALPQFIQPFGIRRFGIDGWNPDGTPAVEVGWDHPDYHRAVRAASEFWYLHENAGDDYASPKAIAWFRSDEPGTAIPLMVDLSHYYARLKYLAPDLDGKWSVAAFPRADDGPPRHVIGGMTYVLFRSGKHQRESFEWLKFLNRLESQQHIVAHRLNRGDASTLTVSPTKAFWDPSQMAFWDHPDRVAFRQAATVLGKVIEDCETTEYIPGEKSASVLEQAMLDQLKSAITTRLSQEASRRAMSRVELITAIARGELPELDRELDAWLNAEITARWTANHPRASAIIAAAVIDQERRFGSSLDELDQLARAPDVLSITLIGVGLLGAVGALCVLIVPVLRRHWVSYAFIAAPTALVGVFVVIPAITALYLSFTEYHPVLPLAAAQWVGLDQYARVFGSRELYHSLGRTVMYVLMSLPPMVLISLALASVLNAARHGQRLWRFIFFCPLVTSMISVALIFTQLFHATEIGWINAVLIDTGLVRDPIRFLESDRWFLPTAAILAIWGGLAFNILIYIAGLQQIPSSLYEAARIDGASSFRRFWHVSLPGLRPQILFTGVIGLIGGFQVFETIFMLGGGTGYAGSKFGPNDAGMTMVPLVFRYGFEYFQMGQASAYSYILFGVILVFTVVQFRLFRDGDRS